MSQALHTLFGAAFTVAVSIALGTLLLRGLRVTFHRLEAALFAFVAGSACLSLATFLLCVIHQARKGVFLWGGLAVIAWAGWRARRQPRRRELPAVSHAWLALFFVIFTAFFIAYFFNALAPEVSPDGSGYHLGNVARCWQQHGFVWDYHSMYAYLSQGLEMLFLVAFCFGRHPAAAMVHFAFLAALPLLMACYGRRFGFPRAALFGAILVFASPVVGMDGASAYNDAAVATLLFAVFYLLQVWDKNQCRNLLILIGLLCGFAYGVKYTACLVLPLAVGFVWWRLPHRARRLRAFLALALPALLMMAPWLLRNWIWLGNPVAPFFNRWFPNPYYHPGMEKIYLEGLRYYIGILHFWEVPLQLTLRGGLTGGMVGPVFLLAPFALLSLRCRQGRRLLLAALVFAVPAYFNTGARFLIPTLPFLSLAMGLGMANSRGVLPALALFHAVVSWPSVLSMYCDSWNWRVNSIPARVALHKELEAAFIQHSIGDYALKGLIEQVVSPKEKIFSFAGRPEAYIDRHIVVGYESALGNLAQDMLWVPLAHPPAYQQRFSFLPVTTRAVRVVNIASADAFWTISEMRAFWQGRELPRSPGWRLSAWPNGWEVQLAFDNSYATRWSTWQAMAPHARVQIDFPRPEPIDEVVLECAPAWEARIQVEVLTERGRWVPLTDTPELAGVDPPSGMRRAATRELKARGIGYLWVNDSDSVAEDMKNYPNSWGITRLAEANGARFYRID
jgi:hypothetical protein